MYTFLTLNIFKTEISLFRCEILYSHFYIRVIIIIILHLTSKVLKNLHSAYYQQYILSKPEVNSTSYQSFTNLFLKSKIKIAF